MEKTYCQSCGMELSREADLGREADGSLNRDYCRYCYDGGAFTQELTMEEMVEFCVPMVVEARVYPSAEEARRGMLEFYPQLKRWKR